MKAKSPDKYVGAFLLNKNLLFDTYILDMIELNINDLQSNVVVTLELATKPFFIFKFTHVLTKDIVSFVAGPDISQYKYRYNEFVINTSVLFAGKKQGEWHYIIYQSDTDDLTVQNDPLEYGKMLLSKDESSVFTQYEGAEIKYKAYGN